ncbi:MAG: hypothetical protein ABMA14_01490 [Hyphomonadaceae bacterium]
MSQLVRVGAVAAMIGGGLRVVSTFIPYQADLAWLEALYGVIDLCLLFGLIGIYLFCAEALGTLGLIAFLVALAGVASIFGPDTPAFGIDFYRVGALVFVLGLAALGALLWSRGVLRSSAALWVVTLAAALASATWPPAFMVSGLALGVGYLLAGAAIWRGLGSR